MGKENDAQRPEKKKKEAATRQRGGYIVSKGGVSNRERRIALWKGEHGTYNCSAERSYLKCCQKKGWLG